MAIKILGTGSCVGEIGIDNNKMFGIDRSFDIEKAKASLAKNPELNLSEMNEAEIYDAHVQAMSGIKKRYWTKGTAEELGAEASRLALDSAGITSKELDFIVACSFSGHYKIPNVALSIADMIGNPNLPFATPNAACSGFIYGLEEVFLRISSRQYSTGLIVATEKLSENTNLDDYKTAFLFGDGAGAVVVGADEGGMTSIPYVGAEYSRGHITFKRNGLIEMEGGSKVLAKAVKAMEKSLVMALLYKLHTKPVIDEHPEIIDEEIKNRIKLGYHCKSIDWVIPHPANLRIFNNLREKFSDVIDSGQWLENIVAEGNISGASLPRILDLNVRNGNIQRGNMIAMTAVGGGYTFGGAYLKY